MKKEAADLYALALVYESIGAKLSIDVTANNAAIAAENISAFIAALAINLQGVIDDKIDVGEVMQLVTDPLRQSK